MSQPVIQTSFHAGEWSPALNARVDLAKYRAAAALLENFFVDYRGGASSRPGTKYIIQAYKSSTAVRLIPFQASFTVGYVLEFGDFYVRFINNGSVVLETALNITGATQANPCVVSVVNSFQPNDVVYITGVSGMTELNGEYFLLTAATAGTITLADLNGVAINSLAFGAYSGGGTVARVYTLSTPYAAGDLEGLKFAQSVNRLILCHPSYVPYSLQLISASNWVLNPITFGTLAATPTNVAVATTLAGGTVNYAYTVTSVDSLGEESASATPAVLANKTDLRTIAGTNTISWTAVSGAASYNVYKAEITYGAAVPTGAAFGFIGNCTGVSFSDSNISPDFSETPPIVQNPFQGAGVASVTVTAAGVYTTVPTVTIDAAPAGGSTATATAVLQIQTVAINNAGTNYNVGEIVTITGTGGGQAVVATVDGFGGILTFQPLTYPGSNRGAINSGSTPTNPRGTNTPSGPGNGANVNLTWGVGLVTIISAGAGYTTVPAVTFSAGAAAATAVLADASAGNPSAVSFFQQRLVLAAPPEALQTYYMSQPGAFFNFNISNPIQPDDAITASIVDGQLNEIQSMVSVPAGLVMLTSRAGWLINGGSPGSPVTPIDDVANSQAYNGANEVPPIKANFDILFVQAKGSVVRDLTYNFYANIYTGTDISVLSSHLFFGHTIKEWAWAEEPFKLVWAVRDDGVMLILTFLKEQELIGWTHSTTEGLFKSVATITEAVSFGNVDAVYTVVERTINGNTVKYIERVAERIFPNGMVDAWCVDAGLQYDGVPATSFTGGEHLAGATCVGLADGLPITPFVMPTDGEFTLPSAASKVTIGLAYTPQLQTLPLDLGEPTVQGKMKVIPAVTVRVQETLGLQIGSTFATAVNMKDLQLGQVGSATNERVTDLVTGDAMTVIDARYTVPGQYCIQQPNPLPASILGVIPEITVGDTAK